MLATYADIFYGNVMMGYIYIASNRIFGYLWVCLKPGGIFQFWYRGKMKSIHLYLRFAIFLGQTRIKPRRTWVILEPFVLSCVTNLVISNKKLTFWRNDKERMGKHSIHDILGQNCRGRSKICVFQQSSQSRIGSRENDRLCVGWKTSN